MCKSKTDKSISNRKYKKNVFQNCKQSSHNEISQNETCLYSLKEQNNDQPFTVTALQNQVSIQNMNVKIENYQTKIILDTGCAIDLINKET